MQEPTSPPDLPMGVGFDQTGPSQLDLDEAEQDERDLQIAVSGAQRLLHDSVLQQFLSEMRKVGEQYAVYGTTPEARELNRVKVIAIDELRGHLQAMARVNQERLEDEVRARAQE